MPVPNEGLPSEEYLQMVKEEAARLDCAFSPSAESDLLYLVPKNADIDSDIFNTISSKISAPMCRRDDTVWVRWTGWKWNPREVEETWSIKMVAQWAVAVGVGPRRHFYVNLPGGEMGEYYPGGCFDIGMERVDGDEILSDIEDMITFRFDLLAQYVKQRTGVEIAQLSS